MAASSRLVPLAALLALVACRRPARVSPAAPDASMADGRIAGVALLANSVEVGYAAIAATRASHRDVRTYAARMRTDHSSLNAALADLLARLDLAALDDAASAALRDSSLARRDAITTAPARDFDAAYVERDIRSHHDLIAVVDRLRDASAESPELREYVASLRPILLAHLAHGERVRASLTARRR